MAKPKPNSRPFVASNRPLRKAVADYRVKLNAAQSPFFKLPPDLRNVIYGLVLGKGWGLHVDKNHNVYVCDNTSEMRDFADEHPSGRVKYETHRDWYGRHIRYSTALLRVCRQINQEAALIPFHANNLIVDLGYFQNFLPALVPAQREAIKSLELGESLDLIKPLFMHSDLTKQLISLRTLKVAVRRCSKYTEVQSQLEKLCDGLLASVTVKEFHCAFMHSGGPRQYPRQFDDWAEKMETELPSPTTYLERRGENFCAIERAMP